MLWICINLSSNICYPVHAVLTPLNTCRASRACRDERVAPCCKTSATQHATTFSGAKMRRLDIVSCCDVTQQVEFWLKRTACVTVVGCADVSPPRGAEASRDGDVTVIRCNETDETWYLSCSGTRWTGIVGVCSTHHRPPAASKTRASGDKRIAPLCTHVLECF